MATISKLVTELDMDSSDFDRGVRSASKEVSAFKKLFGGVGGAGSVAGGFLAANAITAGFGALTGGISGAIDLASDLNESISKTGVVFGDSANAVMDWSRTTATALGLPRGAALEAVSTFGNLFNGMGLTQDASAGMSQDVLQLAADLSSFNNVPVDQVLEDIRSGLVGEAEPLRKYGVLLNEANVQQKAMEMTGKGTAKMLTEQDKLLARNALIFEQTTSAQGDFARTADGAANASRILQARITDMRTALGQKLLPIYGKVIGAMNHFIDSFTRARARGLNPFQAAMKALRSTLMDVLGRDAFRSLRQSFVEIEQIIARVAGVIKDVFVAAFGLLKRNMDIAGPAIKGLAIAFGLVLPILGIVAVAIGVLTSPIFLLVAAIVALTIAWETNFLNIQGIVGAVVGFVLPLLQRFADWFTGTAVPAIAAFAGAVIDFIGGQVIPAIAAIWDRVGGPLTTFAGWFSGIAIDAVKLYVTSYIEAFQRVVRAAEWLWDHAGSPLRAFREVFGTIAGTIRTFSEVVRRHINRAADFLGNLWTAANAMAADVSTEITNVVGYFVGLYNGARDKIEGSGAFFTALQSVVEGVVDPIRAAAETIAGVIGKIGEAGGWLLDKVTGSGGPPPDMILGAMKAAEVANSIIGPIEDGLNLAAEAIPGLEGWSKINETVADLVANLEATGGGKATMSTPEITVKVNADIAPFSGELQKVWTAGGLLAAETFTTKLSADAGPFKEVYNPIAGLGGTLPTFEARTWTTNLAADTSPFDGAMWAAIQAGLGFQNTRFTTTLDANIGPALAAINELANYLPSSPAKRGPLSKLPSFDFVADAFASTLSGMTAPGLSMSASPGVAARGVAPRAGGGLVINNYGTINVPAGYDDFADAMGAWSRGEASA